jgi:DNA-binding NarL/FixJ family response regulator
LIEKQPGLEVVGEANSGRMALKLTRELKPDVVIMDITMPDLNGIEAARQIHSEIPGVKVIALSMHSDKCLVAGMLMAGASGYLLKEDCDSGELARAIRAVAINQTYLSPKIGEVVIKDYVRHLSMTASSPFSILTPREREVLQLLAEGKNAKEIASSLHVSVKTVETHRNKIMEKLDIRSIAELTKYAIRERLTPL